MGKRADEYINIDGAQGTSADAAEKVVNRAGNNHEVDNVDKLINYQILRTKLVRKIALEW